MLTKDENRPIMLDQCLEEMNPVFAVAIRGRDTASIADETQPRDYIGQLPMTCRAHTLSSSAFD